MEKFPIRANLVKKLQKRLDAADQQLIALAERLSTDTQRASFILEWSAEEFRAAGIQEVLGKLIPRLEEPDRELRQLHEWALNELLIKAQHVNNNGSPTANLVQASLVAALAYAFQQLGCAIAKVDFPG